MAENKKKDHRILVNHKTWRMVKILCMEWEKNMKNVLEMCVDNYFHRSQRSQDIDLMLQLIAKEKREEDNIINDSVDKIIDDTIDKIVEE